ncbi:hypothetical protein EDB87DRAFT_1685812 [Lactarius vividus]|nr:hypothetical protein EDB87DRAFT_1685812 [Lactarius vividus]
MIPSDPSGQSPSSDQCLCRHNTAHTAPNHVSALPARVARLILDGGSPSGTPSRIREREIVRRPLDVIPRVASTTAAALNAEQSVHRLKEALLTVRTEPLLNTQAAYAKPTPLVFDTLQPPSSSTSKGTNIFSTLYASTP